ncbi:Uma2 family endonuclease [Thiohalocapsa marina]|uniref:Uma2 family endonuclease n=1 Tax=Thiohalocapsa marina TaxID=424902 RepID=UPI0036DA7F96
MTVAAQTLPRMDPEAFLAFERDAECRHELVDGYLFAMTGASARHGEILANLLAAIHTHLRGGPCRVYGSNLKIRVEDDFFYPDLFVRCGQDQGDPYFKTDPLLIVEIHSPNTQRYDRGDKRLAYQRLDSLRDYVLIHQDAPLVEAFRRHDIGWDNQARIIRGPDGLLELPSIGLTIALADLYA